MTLHSRLPLRSIAAWPCLGLALGSTLLAAQDERDLTTPVATYNVFDQTEAQLAALRTSGWRITNLEVRSAGSPTRFDALLVNNVGPYQRSWWFYGDLSAAEMSGKVLLHHARFAEIEPYVRNGEVRYAATLVDNQGSNYEECWFFYTTTLQALGDHINQRTTRIYDLDSFVLGGTRYYTALTIKNTGSNGKPWWWLLGVSQQQVYDFAVQNSARIVDLERNASNDYNAVFVAQGGVPSWLMWGLTPAQTAEYAAQFGARLIDAEGYVVNGTRYYDCVFVNNVNAATFRVGQAMRTRTDGWVGAYLKRAGGATVAGFNQSRPFEPASLLKTLHHVHAMKQVVDGLTTLDANLTFYDGNPGESCPSNTNLTTESLQQVLSGMMMASSNSRTRAITNRFGMSMIQGTAGLLGMSQTQLNHHIGCAGTPNQLTLVDIGRLHERVIGGYLGNQRETFYALMRNDFYGTGYAEGHVKDVLDQEKVAVGLSDAQFTSFRANMRIVGKKGGYGVPNVGFHRTWGAYVRLPFYDNGGIDLREYVTGAFVNAAGDEPRAIEAAYVGASEVLREEIRAAMLSWRNHVFGSFVGFGSGCAGSAGVPWHSGTGVPEIGQVVNYQVSSARAASPAVLLVGASNTQWNGMTLPVSLGFLGAPSCALRVAPHLMLTVTTSASGTATRSFTVPVSTALIHGGLHTQYAVFDPAANAAGLAFSRGLTTTLGGQP